jgi:hypothetical protein
MSFNMVDNWSDVAGYKIAGLAWTKIPETADGCIFRAEVEDKVWMIRMNDFPDEPLYTLIVDGREIIHLAVSISKCNTGLMNSVF